MYRLGHVHIASLPRLIHKMPFTVSAFAVGGISLVGIPLTAGFISKWQLISASLDKGWAWLAALVLISSIMAVLYIGKVIHMLCLSGAEPTQDNNITEAPRIMWMSTWLLLLVSLYIGLNSTELVELTQQAANQLFAGME